MKNLKINNKKNENNNLNQLNIESEYASKKLDCETFYFGTAENKTNMIITTPIASVFWFFGVFFVIFIQK